MLLARAHTIVFVFPATSKGQGLSSSYASAAQGLRECCLRVLRAILCTRECYVLRTSAAHESAVSIHVGVRVHIPLRL